MNKSWFIKHNEKSVPAIADFSSDSLDYSINTELIDVDSMFFICLRHKIDEKGARIRFSQPIRWFLQHLSQLIIRQQSTGTVL